MKRTSFTTQTQYREASSYFGQLTSVGRLSDRETSSFEITSTTANRAYESGTIPPQCDTLATSVRRTGKAPEEEIKYAKLFNVVITIAHLQTSNSYRVARN